MMFIKNKVGRMRASVSRFRSINHWLSVEGLPIHQAYKDLGCIFVHIPKTAGLSISHALFSSASQHRTLYQYRLIFGNTFVENSFCFSFCRDPLSRFISASKFLLRGGISASDHQFYCAYLKHAHSVADVVQVLRSNPQARNYYHFIPQTEFISDPICGTHVDFIGRYESIESDFQKICQHLGINRTLPRLNATNMIDQCSDLGNHDLLWLKSFYRKDYLSLGY